MARKSSCDDAAVGHGEGSLGRDAAMEGEIDTADLLSRTNELLQRVGINALPIPSLEELQQSASSMFVAVFEAIFQNRLREVTRAPSRSEHWTNNAQVVINKLQLLPLAHGMLTPDVTGAAVVAGHPRVISLLVDIFTRISDVYKAAEMSGSNVTGSSGPEQEALIEASAGSSSSQRGGTFDASADSGDTVPQPESSKLSSQSVSEEDERVSMRGAGSRSGSARASGGAAARAGVTEPMAREAAAVTAVKIRRRPHKRQKKSAASPAGLSSTASSSHGGGAARGGLHSTGAGELTGERPQTTPAAAAKRKVRRPSTSHASSSSRPGHKGSTGSGGGSSSSKRAAATARPGKGGSTRPWSAPTGERPPTRRAFSGVGGGGGSSSGLETEAFGRGFPSMWQSFLTQYLRKKSSDSDSGRGVEQRERHAAELRNEMYMRQYEEAVGDQERSERLKHMAEARQAEMQAKSLAYRERVERIKATRLAETIKAQRISERMKKETLSENRMRFLLQQILKRLHEWKRDEDKEELDRVKELHRYGLLQADVIESMYRERLSMAKEAQRRRKEENKAVYRAQEVLLASILRELVGLRDERIKVLMERDKHRQAAALRKSDELFHTICEIMQVEDWEGMRRDRFTTRHGSGLDQFLRQTRVSMDKQRMQHARQLKDRRFKQAYGGI